VVSSEGEGVLEGRWARTGMGDEGEAVESRG